MRRSATGPRPCRARYGSAPRTRPMQDNESLEVVISDGTGEVSIQFMGRRAIRGLTLGTRVVVEGVIGEQHGRVLMMNPRLELTI